MNKKLNVIETAETHGKFNTFTRALEFTGLSEMLKDEGPFTVFAPSDAAFDKLSDITLNNLSQPQNIEKLRALLKYHIVSGKLMTADMENQNDTQTLHGQNVKIDRSNGVRINNVSVHTGDIEASNGVIHLINNVLMPSKVTGSTR